MRETSARCSRKEGGLVFTNDKEMKPYKAMRVICCNRSCGKYRMLSSAKHITRA